METTGHIQYTHTIRLATAAGVHVVGGVLNLGHGRISLDIVGTQTSSQDFPFAYAHEESASCGKFGDMSSAILSLLPPLGHQCLQREGNGLHRPHDSHTNS